MYYACARVAHALGLCGTHANQLPESESHHRYKREGWRGRPAHSLWMFGLSGLSRLSLGIAIEIQVDGALLSYLGLLHRLSAAESRY